MISHCISNNTYSEFGSLGEKIKEESINRKEEKGKEINYFISFFWQFKKEENVTLSPSYL